jgi:hypothetical protein
LAAAVAAVAQEGPAHLLNLITEHLFLQAAVAAGHMVSVIYPLHQFQVL